MRLKPISLFEALGVKPKDKSRLAAQCGISAETLAFWDKSSLLPSEAELEILSSACSVSPLTVKLRMGIIDPEVADLLRKHAGEIGALAATENAPISKREPLVPAFQSSFGKLFQGDCIDVMQRTDAESFDVVFADPPFNLNKQYPSQMDDRLKEDDYLKWCYGWLDECVRVLKRNGSLFVYNIPKWNVAIAHYLAHKLVFRDWIAVDLKGHLPLAGRLYPSHYSLLYFCKGDRPHAFHPDRMPMKVCPTCYEDLVDYGGYKSKMNEAGVSLTDIWTDIPLVRHSKNKRREGANELSLKLLDRVLELASNEGDTVFDPFGGSGTTYAVAELKRRKWVGVELGPVDGIIDRLQHLEEEREALRLIREKYNHLFAPSTAAARRKRGLWTCDSVRSPKTNGEQVDFVLNEVPVE